MIKLTSLACEMSSTNQMNSIPENGLPAVLLRCDYWNYFLSSQVFQVKNQGSKLFLKKYAF